MKMSRCVRCCGAADRQLVDPDGAAFGLPFCGPCAASCHYLVLWQAGTNRTKVRQGEAPAKPGVVGDQTYTLRGYESEDD